MGAETWILDVLREGYRIAFSVPLPLTTHFKEPRGYAPESLKGQALRCPSPPVKDWLRLLGHLSSLINLVPGTRRRMRLVQIQLNQQWDRQLMADDHPIH
ncbi:hypothetical protein E2C01_046230 [Portunus trituberculatus]|uniref:Uncharacterized protein n=1 Tax=Portunus trituberculatus TaxID=210409 RepID=A0A5B7G0E0_PORTR|nr:hypothetical protein [Portunus trituberculatus]